MITIGDVLMVFGGLLALAGPTWAALVLAAVLFTARTASAAHELEEHPWRAWWSGLVATFLAVTATLVLINMPLPLLKFAGFVVLGLFVTLSILGAGGLTRIIAMKVKGAGGSSEQFSAYLRGAGLLVGTCSIPLVGWLVLAPIVLILGAGAGLRAFMPAKAPERFGAEA